MIKNCLKCNSLFDCSGRKKNNKFCSCSCAASFNNTGRIKQNKKPAKQCLYCKKEIPIRNKKYCDHFCQAEYQYLEYINSWRNEKEKGYYGKKCQLDPRIKRYIKEKYHNKCTKCYWCEINSITKTSPLHIDHVDGNAKNNKENNLILLCPNCHSLTPTFGALNKGRSTRNFLL